MTITALGADVHLIDTAMSGYAGITAAYAILGSKPCLVETGTATSAKTVVDALASLGVGPTDLATIVVTHIHLDHAGGVGDLAAAFPNARIVVQQSGARHLADPSRLMASARRVFGAAMDEVFGELLPTDATRIDAIDARGRVDLGGGRHLEGHHTPGHARHHLGLVDSATGDLYVGDAAGLYVPPDEADPLTGLAADGSGAGTMLPGTPPPDFDLGLALASLGRMRDLGSTRLLFSHYGPITQVADSLARAEEELRLWVGLVREARSEQLDLDHTLALVRERTKDRYAALLARTEVAEKFEALSSSTANVVGISRWLERLDAETEHTHE
ncbi:MAG TPA: MBL fold metallo-hydrolase [Actinospica sp.]|jgi:glyoxylase-like metal-dependent hydrolase (beta-lactamase superfamily II)|nr:MBL fold metallo-hydrolase [Actinospica sp.]